MIPKAMNTLLNIDDHAERRYRWLTRNDAVAVGLAIAMSEPWPRRLIVAILARLSRLTRMADGWLCIFEGFRENIPVSPAALSYLNTHLTRETLDALRDQYDLDISLNRPTGGVMRLEVLLMLLGAAYFEKAVQIELQKQVAAAASQADLVAKQRQALGWK